jgi:putative DNA primase/helicase
VRPYDYAHHYASLGFALVPLEPGSKSPRGQGWQRAGVDASYWRTRPEMGMGLIHGLSGTAALDVDMPEWAAMALGAVGIDLAALESAAAFRLRGKKGEKPVYTLPDGVTLTRKPLAWPHPTEKGPNGKPKLVTLFELRAGDVQDVLPPSLHPDTGRPYEWLPGIPLSRDEVDVLPGPLLELWRNWEEAKRAMVAACPWAEVAPASPRAGAASRAFRGNPDESPIAAFNRAYTVGEVLERNGYRRVGKRYVCPSSSTGLPGVTILEGRAYSHHGSDVLAGEHTHDAFGVYTLLEHGGDVGAAVKAAARLLGMAALPRRGGGESADRITVASTKKAKPHGGFKARVVHPWR